MADTIQVQRWSRPWQPAADARLEETLDYLDMPTAGIVEQHGVRHLFVCLAGQLASTHIWVYRPITDSEATRLRQADTEELKEVVNSLLVDGPMVLAVADDEDGIFGSTHVETLEEAALRDAVRRVIDEVRDHLDTVREQAEASRDLVSRV